MDNVCCKVLNLYLKNDAYVHQGRHSGEYNIQNDKLINYNEYYVSSNGESAIWYYNGKWIVNDIFHLETSVSSLASTDGPICPDYTQAWTYYSDGNFKDGRNDIRFIVVGSCWA